MFSGLTENMVFHNQNDWSASDREFVPLCKVPRTGTVTDFWAIGQTALTTNTTGNHIRVVFQNGKTTGNQTTAIGVISSAWVAYTGKTRGTNYTLSANHWLRCAFSEAGTQDMSQTSAGAWIIYGNV